MRAGDSKNAFEIYPDNLTDEIELSIFNRGGQLIYYCGDKNLVMGSSHPACGMERSKVLPSKMVHI